MIKEISQNFFMITLPMPFRLRHVHIFAMVHDGYVTLFDTGLNLRQTISTLESDLGHIGKTLHQVDRIFITHYHADHCGIAGRIQEISGAKVLMSSIDWERTQINITDPDIVARLKGFYSSHGLPEESFRTLTKMQKMFRNATVPFTVENCLEPNGWYNVDSRTFQSIPVPGHSRGQVCFYFPAEGILLSGDHVLPDITPNLSPDLSSADFRPLQSFLSSLSRIQDLPVSRVYPAHGNPFDDLEGRIEEIREHHIQRTILIRQSTQNGMKTTFQISEDIFGQDLPDFDRFLALNETYVHLVELREEGQVLSMENTEGKIQWSAAG